MSINIENIMNEIRQEIKEKGYTYDMLSFSETAAVSADMGDEISISQLNANLNVLNSSFTVVSVRPLLGNKIAVFVKKVIRKLTKFYVEPIVASQNEFNAFNVRVLNEISKFIRSRVSEKSDEVKFSELTEQLSDLNLKLKEMSSEVQTLTDRIALLEAENSQLKKHEAE